jgi:purine-binding chemotaxis protein CheW
METLSESLQLCTLTLDRHWFGIEVTQIQEILRWQQLTPVPLAPPVVRGLMNLRGQIVTALDLRRRLELPERAADAEPTNVVVRTEGGVVSLIADAVGDVIEVPRASVERPPETLRGTVRDLTRGACKLRDRLLLVLDVAAVVRIAT